MSFISTLILFIYCYFQFAYILSSWMRLCYNLFFIVVIPDFDITSYTNLVKSIKPCSLSYSLKEIGIEIIGLWEFDGTHHWNHLTLSFTVGRCMTAS